MRHPLAAVTAFAAATACLWAGCSPHHDPTPPNPDPAALAPPPSGQGFQMQTEAFAVDPGNEIQDCYFFKVSDLAKANGVDPAQPFNLHRVQTAQLPGSHHMNIFRVRSIVGLDPAKGALQHGLNGQGECFKSANWADWPLIANTQTSTPLDWEYPEGVANVLNPDEWLMLQTHYVNATTQKSPASQGHVAVNFWSIPADKKTAELGTIFATKQSIRVCAHNPTPTFHGSCQFKSQQSVNIIGANGHFHARGHEFDIFKWDGTSTTPPDDSARFYQSKAWDDPPMLHSPELSVQVPQGGGIWYTCDYQWTPPDPSVGGCDALNAFDKTKYMTADANLDCCYTFGPIVEKNEHCNAFIYYYPKQDDVTCF